MNLRPYQERAVSSVLASFLRPIVRTDEKTTGRGTLVVAATGAGKTIKMAHIGRRFADYLGRPPNILILQHRRELVTQNRKKFQRVNRDWAAATYSGEEKRFARASGYCGAATFAMAQSLAQPRSLARLPAFDLILVDEAHHAVAPQQTAILARAVEINPDVRFCGVTATPERADGKGLGVHFDHVADIITISELVQEGYLVTPRGLVADIGLGDALHNVARRKKGGDYDMKEVAKIVDRPELTRAIIERWSEVAGDRQTAVFCATVAHAQHVCAEFEAAGVRATVITGKDEPEDRARRLAAYSRREFRVVVNVGTLTEGWDDPQTSCIVLLRSTASRSLLIQIIGRGLRIVDFEEIPDAAPKSDCLILDFAASLEKLGGLATVIDLDAERRKREPGPPPMKPCGECRRAIPLWARECPLCGYVYPEPKAPEAADAVQAELLVPEIVLRPIDLLLKTTLFAWIDLPDRDGKARGRTKIASGGKAWALVTSPRDSGVWFAFGATESASRAPQYLATGTLDEAMSHADAFLSREGDAKKYGRGSFYMRQPPSAAQLELAGKRHVRVSDRATMYEVGCWLTADLNRSQLAAMVRDLLAAGDEVAA